MDTEDHCSSSSHPRPTHKLKASRRKVKESSHPVYQGGVCERNVGKRICEVPEPHKKSRLWLGPIASTEMAARADDAAAISLHSSSAPLNFPEFSPVDIRIAAAEMSQESSEQREGPKPKMMFVVEEEMFNMPELMDEMAAGMLVTPLAMQRGFDWDGVECYVDLSLWSDCVDKRCV